MILAIDQGTTGTHVLLVDETGAVCGKAYREITQHFPRPGWVEHDAEEIWQTVLDSTAEVLAAESSPGLALAGIGITNQRETFVLWDRATLRPVAPAIVWQCRRSVDICRSLKNVKPPPVAPGCSPPSAGGSEARSATRSRAPSSSPARRCSGCATASA